MHVHFIIHESYEGPGALTRWISGRGFKQTCTRLYLGDALPSQLDFDLLIIVERQLACPVARQLTWPVDGVKH